MRARSFSTIPLPVSLLLVAGIVLQIGWSLMHPLHRPGPADLPPPPAEAALRVAALGEEIALARLVTLAAQSFDNQSGVNLSFVQLDYAKLEGWLDLALRLDPRSQYPLLLASRVYADVPDPVRKRRMLDFIYRSFLDDPDRRWPALAQAALVAKHQLRDLPLARRYAAAVRQHAQGKDVPHWASQMEIFILEDMNEIESAKIMLGGLLQSGKISDPAEMRFLSERLRKLESKLAAQGRTR